MAEEIHVGYATYRLWENGRDQYAGPTRLQTDLLNKALRKLLGSEYTDGEAFDVWGWPRERDMRYDQVVDLLRSAGFDVWQLNSNGRPPAQVFWVHRVRVPNLVHGVFALAAAAATRAGIPVYLLLDDVDMSDPRQRLDLCRDFEDRVRRWVAFASGDDAKLSTGLFSSVLTDDYLARRGWSAVNDYLNAQTNVLEILRAGKVISPLHFDADPEKSVLELFGNEESQSPRADRLVTPLQNWLVFEAEIARLLAAPSVGASDSVVTLGGHDERILWEVWDRGCSDDLAARVRHVFLKPMPMPSYRGPWQESALYARTDRPLLTNYLIRRTASDGNCDLIEWLLRSAIRLPAALNPGFRDGLDPVLRDVDGLLRAQPSELAQAAGAVAKAVAEWLTL
jgi:hypothetical protein